MSTSLTRKRSSSISRRPLPYINSAINRIVPSIACSNCWHSTRDNTTGTRFLRPEHRNFGEFKVPSLRNLKLTAPYMHNGSLANLRDVVRHYSELDEDRLHADGERILKPLHLTDRESKDLVAFLESLSPDKTLPLPAIPPAAAACL